MDESDDSNRDPKEDISQRSREIYENDEAEEENDVKTSK